MVTPSPCEAYERLWDARLRAHYDSDSSAHRWAATQGGFRKGHGCPEQAYLLHQTIRARLAPGAPGHCYVAFIDLWRAFPSTNRDALLVRLWQAGVRGHSWRCLRDLGRGWSTTYSTGAPALTRTQ